MRTLLKIAHANGLDLTLVNRVYVFDDNGGWQIRTPNDEPLEYWVDVLDVDGASVEGKAYIMWANDDIVVYAIVVRDGALEGR